MPSDRPTVIAIVGGEGTRMFPLTLKVPKPLLSICGYPTLLRMFEILAHQGCREFVFASKGMENTTRLKEYFKWGRGFSSRLNLDSNVTFKYQPNYNDNGNADAVRKCIEYYEIKKDVLIVSGDNILDINLDKFVNFHKEKNALMTVGLTKVDDVSQYGVADMTPDGRIKRFVEKPGKREAPSNLANIGFYLLSPKIREVFEEMGNRVLDFGFDVIPYLIKNGYPVYGYVNEGYWNDIGTPGRYLSTTQDILRGRVANIKCSESNIYKPNRCIHPTTTRKIKERLERGEIHIGEYTLIGGDCDIGENVIIESSFIGDNCIIGDGTIIMGSVVMDFTNIGKNVCLNKCIIGRYSTIEDSSVVDSGMPVEFSSGEEDLTAVVGENVTVFKGSVIGPKKRVAPIEDSYEILKTKKYLELGYDKKNIYFIEG